MSKNYIAGDRVSPTAAGLKRFPNLRPGVVTGFYEARGSWMINVRHENGSVSAYYASTYERASPPAPTADELAGALAAMFELHEPEGRFQPSHWKQPLARARKALAGYYGCTED